MTAHMMDDASALHNIVLMVCHFTYLCPVEVWHAIMMYTLQKMEVINEKTVT
jgi:hypothetical protein